MSENLQLQIEARISDKNTSLDQLEKICPSKAYTPKSVQSIYLSDNTAIQTVNSE